MVKYFVCQLKRLGRLLPVLLLVMAVLVGGIKLVYQTMVTQWFAPEKTEKLSVGMVGTASDRLLGMGMNALLSMDSSEISVEFLQMEEPQARTALEKGEITAYIVFPEGFMDKALMGEITPLQFVSAAGSENIVSLVKDELTSVIANMLLVSEQGAFALGDVLDENGLSEISYAKVNGLALRYAKQIMDRAEIYTAEQLGVSGGLNFEQYLLSGLSVVFLFFMTLPFAAVFVREDSFMEQLLKSKRIGAVKQVVIEIVAYFIIILILVLIPLMLLSEYSVVSLFGVLPVIFCICAISYFIFSLTQDMLSGVLLQLLVSVALCFVSGCMYPVYFFPVSVQNLSGYLPAAMARNYIAGLITGRENTEGLLPMLTIGLVLLLVSILIRYFRIGGKKGARL